MSDTPEADAVTSRIMCNVSSDFARKLKYERDDLQKAVNGLCEYLGVSPANTTLLAVEVLKIKREREAAIDAIMKIEDIFIDGDDTYEDWKSMGHIARTFLENTYESGTN